MTEHEREVNEKTIKALRELRAEMMDLHKLLTSIKGGNNNVKDNTAYIKKTFSDVENLVSELGKLNIDNENKDSDVIRHIFNVWEQMSGNQILRNPEQVPPNIQEQLLNLTVLQEQCSEIVFHVGDRTIPARVNDWLKKGRPGYYLPFHVIFEDELPSLEGRIHVLNNMAWAPSVINGGIVNVAKGLIYKYEEEAKARRKSLLTVTAAFGLAIVFIILLCNLGTWLNLYWPLKPQHAVTLTICWGAILIGSLTQIGVSSIKRSKVSGLPPVIPVNDLLIYISARKGDILLKILIALIGLFGLAFTVTPDAVTPMNAFLVGYSLENIVELFGTTIEQKAGAQVGALKEPLGICTEKNKT